MLPIPVPVGSLKDLAGADKMEQIVLERSAQGITDEVIASRVDCTGLSFSEAPLRSAQHG